MFQQQGYGPEVDWWSLGVILFEMLAGFPPFFADSPAETCKKVLDWKQTFSLPSDSNISKSAGDLIRKLMTEVDKRIGYNGADEIKKHSFFKDIDWKNIRDMKAPFIPEVFKQLITYSLKMTLTQDTLMIIKRIALFILIFLT